MESYFYQLFNPNLKPDFYLSQWIKWNCLQTIQNGLKSIKNESKSIENGQNRSKIDQLNQKGQKRLPILIDFDISDGFGSIFDLLIDISKMDQNQSKMDQN